jgi:hypothetical protein
MNESADPDERLLPGDQKPPPAPLPDLWRGQEPPPAPAPGSTGSGRGFPSDGPARPGSKGGGREFPSDGPARPGSKGRGQKPPPSRGPANPPVQVRIVWDAKMPRPVTIELGQDERDWFVLLESPGTGPPRMQGAKYKDLTLSAEDGFVVDCSALSRIAVRRTADAINVLLIKPPPHPFPPPVKELFPVKEPRSQPTRKPGLGFRR